MGPKSMRNQALFVLRPTHSYVRDWVAMATHDKVMPHPSSFPPGIENPNPSHRPETKNFALPAPCLAWGLLYVLSVAVADCNAVLGATTWAPSILEHDTD